MDKIANQLNLTSELLGLSDVIITDIKEARDGSIRITVKSTKIEILCPHCKTPMEPYGYGRTLTLRHLPILGREVYIEITPPRGICKHCDNDPTATQALDWFKRNGHQTKPYEDYLMLQLIGSTQSDVAKKEGVTEENLQNIMDRYKIENVDWSTIERIGLLGIDEIAQKKGYKDYVTIITSRYQEKNKILGVIEGKEKASIEAFLSSIPKKKKKTITAVCVDMCSNYIGAVSSILSSDIPIIVDRFHVAKLYRQSIAELRSQELKRLRKELTKESYQSLRPAIKILISKQERYNQKEKEILLPLFKLSPAIKAAYKLSRELMIIYNTHYKKEIAQKKTEQWIRKVELSSVTCLDTFIKTLSYYSDYIGNYFIRRETSGFVEGINNKIKVIKRRCYGIYNLKHLFQRIFLDLQGYDIFLTKHMVTAY
jgi:transposase